MIGPPQAVQRAVQLMLLGAVLTSAGVLFSVLNTSAVHASVIAANNRRSVADRMSASQIETVFHGRVITGAVIGVLAAMLWVAMAILNKQGRVWARNVASVLCALSVVSFLYAIVAVFSAGGGGLGLAVSALNVAIGVAAVLLIWRPESSDYYEARLNEGVVAAP